MDLGLAIGGAVSSLLSTRSRGGWWRDFDTLAGASDEWITGYVGAILAGVAEPRARQAARRAWRRLRWRRAWSAGWGYNRWVPADADTTLWALRLAAALGESRSFRARRGLRFLARHVRESGGVATFAADGPIRRFTRLLRGVSFDGWCSTHTCVTAAAAALNELPGHDRLLDRLRAEQRDDGSWPGYWWADAEYPTMLATEALARADGPGDANRVRRAAAWAGARLAESTPIATDTNSFGSPFATALCLRLLVLHGRPSHAPLTGAAASWLVSSQRLDGSWAPSAALRIPPPDEQDPDRRRSWTMNGRGGGSIMVDVNANYTTATVLQALAAA